MACHLGDLLAGWFGSSLRRDGGEHASRFFAEVEVQRAVVDADRLGGAQVVLCDLRNDDPAPAHPPPQVVDTRRYQRMIGLFGLLLVVIISISFLTTHGVGTAGIPAGKQLHYFAAPLATSSLNVDANTNPPCTDGSS